MVTGSMKGRIVSAVLAASLAPAGLSAQSKTESKPIAPAGEITITGCVERVGQQGRAYLLTHAAQDVPGSKQVQTGGTVLASGLYRLVSADGKVNIAYYTGNRVTVIGTISNAKPVSSEPKERPGSTAEAKEASKAPTGEAKSPPDRPAPPAGSAQGEPKEQKKELPDVAPMRGADAPQIEVKSVKLLAALCP